MVGWSRRNSESEAERKEFSDWFNALSGPEREEYRRKRVEARDKEMRVLIPIYIICLILWSIAVWSLA